MRLTAFTDFSFRVLISLAVREGVPTTIQDIAATHGVSKNHLMKVVQRLGRVGYVETVRGRGGGIRLGRDAASIRLGDVVRAMEEDMDVVPCFRDGDVSCAIRRACRLKGLLARANDAWLAVLDEQTLADLVANDRSLVRLLRAG